MSFLENKEVLIFGGAGMIGSTLANKLVNIGANVTIVDAMLSNYGGNLFNLKDIKSKIDFHKIDIRDKNSIEKIVIGKEYIFNLAAQVSYIKSNIEPVYDLDINCKGILNVLEACKNNCPESKVVFSSSRFVYGETESQVVKEDHPFNCKSIYGIHKLTGEKYHRYYYDAWNLNTVSVRIANPYGPRQQMKHSEWGIVNWFIRQAMESKPITVFGEGLQKRDYIYVSDITDSLIAVAISENTNGGVYNAGSGIGTSFIEMVETIAEVIDGTVIKKVSWPKDRAFVETGDYISDLAKIKKDTDWNPKLDLLTGIKETFQYYKKNKNKYW